MRVCLLVAILSCSAGPQVEEAGEPQPLKTGPAPAQGDPHEAAEAIHTLVLNYRANGRTIELPVGAEFSVELAAPLGGPEGQRYEWQTPTAGGALSFLGADTRQDVERRYWTFRLKVADKKSGKLRINRYYPTGSTDPAPDFGLRVLVTNDSKSE
jgi:hypothetical protein